MDPVRGGNELAAAFARDGVVCVCAALDPAEVVLAARAIDAVLAHPGPLAQVASGADDPWRTSPPFDGLADELPAGAVMDHPLFPVVWPA